MGLTEMSTEHFTQTSKNILSSQRTMGLSPKWAHIRTQSKSQRYKKTDKHLSSCIIPDRHRLKLDINKNRNGRTYTNSWKLNNSQLNENWVNLLFHFCDKNPWPRQLKEKKFVSGLHFLRVGVHSYPGGDHDSRQAGRYGSVAVAESLYLNPQAQDTEG